MKASTAILLCCPKCHSELQIGPKYKADECEIVSGTLSCVECKSDYEVKDGMIFLIENQNDWEKLKLEADGWEEKLTALGLDDEHFDSLPAPTRKFERASGGFDENKYWEIEQKATAWNLDVLKEMLREVDQPKLLDIGTQIGWSTKIIQKNIENVTAFSNGIASSGTVGLGLAKRVFFEKHKICFERIIADAQTRFLKPESVDAIYADMALHHFEYLQRALDQSSVILKDEGIFYAVEPIVNFGIERIKISNDPEDKKNHNIREKKYNFIDMYQMLYNAGFENIKIYPYFLIDEDMAPDIYRKELILPYYPLPIKYAELCRTDRKVLFDMMGAFEFENFQTPFYIFIYASKKRSLEFLDNYFLDDRIREQRQSVLSKYSFVNKKDAAKENTGMVQQIDGNEQTSLVSNTDPSCHKTYSVGIKNNSQTVIDEISVDIYPEKNPSHPERHYGYWNKRIQIPVGGRIDLKITWDKALGQIFYDGQRPDTEWKGKLSEDGVYIVNIVFYAQGKKVESTSIRETIGKKTGNISSAEVIRCDEIGVESPSQLRSAIWFLTFKCNYKCPYCWEVQRQEKGEFKPEPFIDSSRWVEAWNRIVPQVLDITGGEPFLQPGFIDMIESFDKKIKVAITTNASIDILPFVQRIGPDRVISMTLSFHPTQRMSKELFLGRCLLLKNRGFTITVNLVTWPEQMWLIPMYKELFESNGLRFHVDPYAPTPSSPYSFSNRERDFLKEYVGGDRAHWFGEVEKYPVLCSGGFSHLNVQPNGDAYRCIDDKIYGRNIVGNILDPQFALNRSWTRCDDYYRCPGCDKDKVEVRRLQLENKENLKLSEPYSYTL